MYLVFTRMPGESYRRLLRFLLLYLRYVFVFWGGNISEFDRGRLDNIVKNNNKKMVMWKSHWAVLRLYMKKDCTKNIANIK